MRKPLFAMKLLSAAAPALVAAAAAGAQGNAAPGPADIIFTNGQIRTPDGWVEAIAIRDGVIVAVGDNRTVSLRKTKDSRSVDLRGGTMLPGFHDSHVHAVTAGLEQFACSFRPGATPEQIGAAVKACAARKKPGEWIEGGNWVGAVFKDGQQTAALLDRVAPNNPVALADEAHHSLWVNSAAMRLAGINRATPNPAGGIIEKDARGEPTGLLRESAKRLIRQVVPPPTEAARREALILSTNQMLSYGITSFTEAAVGQDNVAILAALSAEGLLKQRVRGCMVFAAAPAAANAAAEVLIGDRARFGRARFALDCVKIFIDGVPTESRTAAMLAPYEGAKAGVGNDGREKGVLLMPQPILNAAVTRFDRIGLTVKFHAAGDAAVRAAIDAVAAARTANGAGGPAHDIAHSSFVDPADIPRARHLGITWEFSPYIWYPTPIAINDIAAAVGPQRMKRWIPIKEALASGAPVIAGSDWPGVPSANPWVAIETMVTRQKPGGSKETLGEGERIGVDEAIRIFTEHAAMHQGHRSEVGSIEPGMRADFVILDRNPTKVAATDIHRIKVRMTFIDGEKVYDAADPATPVPR